jgi:hypothetical protein
MCEEESEDHEAVAKLLEINDSINRTIERYKLIKKGDLEAAERIPRGTLGTSGAGVTKGPNNELSLIDFGEPEQTSQSQAESSRPRGNTLEDDLLGLSLSGNGLPGAISLGDSNGFNSKFISLLSIPSLTSCSCVCAIKPACTSATLQFSNHQSFRSRPAYSNSTTSLSTTPDFIRITTSTTNQSAHFPTTTTKSRSIRFYNFF